MFSAFDEIVKEMADISLEFIRFIRAHTLAVRGGKGGAIPNPPPTFALNERK